MASPALAARRLPSRVKTDTAFLVLDTESIPDGQLLRSVKYADEPELTPEEAIARAQAEARANSVTQSDFLPLTFQIPIAICVLRVGYDFGLQNFACLDAPQFRTREVVRQFWRGVDHYQAKLVTFNGRGFDMPLLELAAFRYGLAAPYYYMHSRHRFGGPLDLLDWLTNFGACRLTGGLNLLAKLLGKPGKMDVAGDQVYRLYQEGKLREINDYCLCDTLDTYFVFLRTRVLTGDISAHQERQLIDRAIDFLTARRQDHPALHAYLAAWTEPALDF